MEHSDPQWQQEILNFKGIKSLIILEKNVNDLYADRYSSKAFLLESGKTPFVDGNELISDLFSDRARGCSYQPIYYNPLSRFTNRYDTTGQVEPYLKAADREASRVRDDEERLNAFERMRSGGPAFSSLVRDTAIIRALLTNKIIPADPAEEGEVVGQDGSAQKPASDPAGVSQEGKPVVVIIDMAARLLTSSSANDPDEIAAFSNLLVAVRDAARPDGVNRNALVLMVNNLRDLPEWFVSSNPDLRSVVVPMPDSDARKCFVDEWFALPPEDVPMGEKTIAETFIDKTDGMTIRELDEIRRMFARDGKRLDKLCSLVDIYKYGLQENKWESITSKLENDPAGFIRRRVKGQDRAVDAVVSVLKRSALGLSGATHSSSSKPKGVLFLSGPTGTGKTEIVKAVTELLFGDERSLLRFDMSEYQADNSDQKLFGAPPGYVGYAEGGQLTNAVRANPFSVILFDEIEKACPSIMDKFLQILEDGRMTDGQGNTVYFSESIIFFTSNIGFSREEYDASGRHVVNHRCLIEPGTAYEKIEEEVKKEMEHRFKPEFLGRVGNNVVVFDYIDDESAAAIVRVRIEQINRTISDHRGIGIEIDPACFDYFTRRSLQGKVKEKGGRGIGNLIETEYLNVISDFIFDEHVDRGDVIHVSLGEGGVEFAKGSGEAADD